MKTLLTAATALSLVLAPLAAEAGPKGRGNGNGNGNGNGAWAQGFHCPPGLADRIPRCEAPGQVRHEEEREERDDRSEDGREDAEDWAEEIVEAAAEDGDDRNMREGLAIAGALVGLALLDQARREAQAEAASTEPVAATPAPSYFSFSEVPSRPSTIEALAAPLQPPTIETVAVPADFGDAVDPGPTLPPMPLASVPSVTAAPSPSLVIPPPPPMAEDVTGFLSGATTAGTGY